MTQDMFETFDNRWRYRSLLLVITGGLVLFLAWASIAQIDEQVRGVGRIIPSGKVRTVQHLEGGIIKDILVEDGQMIEAGAPLFVIENTDAQTSKQEILISIDALKIKLFRLRAEQAELSELNISVDLEKSYPDLVKSEQALLTAKREEFQSKMSGLEERKRQKTLLLSTLQERQSNLREESAIAQKQQGINKNLRELGAVSQSRYLDSQGIVKNFETRIADVQQQLPITEAEKKEVEQALTELRQNYQSGVAEEVNKSELDIRKLQERLVSFTDKVARMTVVSPVKGVIKSLHVNTIGGVIKPGEQLVDILPIDEVLLVEGQVSTNDRGKIYPGLPVEAVITAYDYATYGSIGGKLTEISADSFVDQKGQEFYKIRAELTASELRTTMPLYAGMTVQLNVLAGRVSVLEAILKPFFRLKDRALREA